MNENEFNKQRKVVEFMNKHYANIKIAVANSNGKLDNKNKLGAYSYLGSIFGEFQKEFPEQSMIDLINYVKHYDGLLQMGKF